MKMMWQRSSCLCIWLVCLCVCIVHQGEKLKDRGGRTEPRRSQPRCRTVLCAASIASAAAALGARRRYFGPLFASFFLHLFNQLNALVFSLSWEKRKYKILEKVLVKRSVFAEDDEQHSTRRRIVESTITVAASRMSENFETERRPSSYSRLLLQFCAAVFP